MGYCYFASGPNGGKLVCDGCGVAVGRKRPCLYKYCQAASYCKACWATRKKPHGDYCREHCAPASEREAFRQAKEAELLAAGKFVRVSCLSVYTEGGSKVHVLFKNAENTYRGYYVSHEAYEKTPPLKPVTVETYEALMGGPLEPAPAEFKFN